VWGKREKKKKTRKGDWRGGKVGGKGAPVPLKAEGVPAKKNRFGQMQNNADGRRPRPQKSGPKKSQNRVISSKRKLEKTGPTGQKATRKIRANFSGRPLRPALPGKVPWGEPPGVRAGTACSTEVARARQRITTRSLGAVGPPFPEPPRDHPASSLLPLRPGPVAQPNPRCTDEARGAALRKPALACVAG